jgi:hypothetical protein
MARLGRVLLGATAAGCLGLATLYAVPTQAATSGGTTGSLPAGGRTASVTVTGTVDVTVSDNDDGTATYQAYLRTSGSIIALPASVSYPSGTRITVRLGRPLTDRGIMSLAQVERAGLEVLRAPDAQALSRAAATAAGTDGGGRLGVISAASKAEWGTHSVVVVPIDFTTPDGNTSASLTTFINGDPDTHPDGDIFDGVDDYWSAVSNGKIRFNAIRVLPWRKASASAAPSASTCDPNAVWDQARAAVSKAGLKPKHIVVYTERVDCGFSGIAEQPGSMVWINGQHPQAPANAPPLATVGAHELGHNLGLDHSKALSCDRPDGHFDFFRGATGCPSQSGTVDEYGDPYDTMGLAQSFAFSNSGTTVTPIGRAGYLSPGHASQLGLLSASAVRSLTWSRLQRTFTVHVAPYAATAGVRVLSLPLAKGRWLDVAYRQASGADSWLRDAVPGITAGPVNLQGVVLWRRSTSSADAFYGAPPIYLVSTDPADEHSNLGLEHAALNKRTFRDVSGISVTAGRTDASGVDVTVVLPADATAPGAPTKLALTGGSTVSRSEQQVHFRAGDDALSGVARYDLLVDAKPFAHAGPDQTDSAGDVYAYLPSLKAGKHTFTVRSVDNAGNAKTSAKKTFKVDGSLPYSTGVPKVVLRNTIIGAKVPVQVTWSPHAARGIPYQWLMERQDRPNQWSIASTTILGAKRSAFRSLSTDRAYSFAVTVFDQAGSQDDGPYSDALNASTLGDGAATYSPGWSVTRSAKLAGGSAHLTKTKATLSFSGSFRSIGWVSELGAGHGSATVYVDGKRVATISTFAKKTSKPTLVWSRNFAATGTHTIMIKTQATKGHPAVAVDGLVTLS